MKCLTLLLVTGCAAPTLQQRQACSDKAYASLVAQCAAAAVTCRQQGGTESECGTVCDQKADQWQRDCSP